MPTETTAATFTLQELMQRVAERIGIQIGFCYQDTVANRVVVSQMVKSYVLDDRLLRLLAAHKIRATWKVEEGARGAKRALIDENDDALNAYEQGRYTTCWEFPRDRSGSQDDAEVSLSIQLSLGEKEEGILVRGLSMGRLTGPSHYPSSFRLFQILTKNDPLASMQAKFMAASNGEFFLSWEAMGLPGLRSMSELFKDFAQGKPNVVWLGSGPYLLKPRPLDHYRPGDKIFLLPSDQERIYSLWWGQLKEFRESLELD